MLRQMCQHMQAVWCSAPEFSTWYDVLRLACCDGSAVLPAGLRAAAGTHGRATDDGSQARNATIACNKVNDNYCDCPDGSDEPGSAACSQLVSLPMRKHEARANARISLANLCLLAGLPAAGIVA